MFSEDVLNKYPDFVINQVIMASSCYFIGFFLFENPPDFSSDLSNYLQLSKQEIITKTRVDSFNKFKYSCNKFYKGSKF